MIRYAAIVLVLASGIIGYALRAQQPFDPTQEDQPSISEYDVVQGDDLDELERKVKARADQAWTVVGGVTRDETAYLQVMVK